MSHPSSHQRSLTLTEELERLEQSITLTLQEIDHNFSRAHRIVTTSILPIVEQYAEHSREVWDGAKFWKQFFEASANVSLSGYEEQPSMQAYDETVTEESHHTEHTSGEEQESFQTPSSEHISLENQAEDLDMSNMTLSPSQSTPRALPPKPEMTANFAEYPSPYEALRREVTKNPGSIPQQESAEPITPGKTSAFNDISMTPESSPFIPPNAASVSRPSASQKKTDPILHRVLDKNYRIAATPMTSQRTKFLATATRNDATTTPATQTRFGAAPPDPDFSSSPLMPEAPQLNTEVFSSPMRGLNIPPSARKPRTPGISVLTPAGKRAAPTTNKDKNAAQIWDSDSDGDDDPYAGGPSPPKTFSFHVPQSRLLKTPAKEASKRIVNSLLQNAGAARAVLRTPRVGGGPDGGTAASQADEYDYELDPELDLTGDIDYDSAPYPPAAGKYDWTADDDDDDNNNNNVEQPEGKSTNHHHHHQHPLKQAYSKYDKYDLDLDDYDDDYGQGGGGGGYDEEGEEGSGHGGSAHNDITDSPSVVKGRGGNLGEMTF